jgi:maltose alpha-D-glucosyltransferase/alpha-amylase
MHWFEGYNDLFTSENSFFRASGKGDISHFLYNFFSQYASTKGKGYISLPVGNHDVIRINNKGRDQRDLEIIQVFNFTMPNVPFVYYGDEIGMRQLDVKVAHEGSYGLRGGARTPMQWNGDNNFGFSTASPDKLYLPVDTAVSAPNVMLQETDDASMLHLVRKLTKLHKTEPALHNYATFIPVYAQKDKYPFIYLRVLGKEKVLVVLNPSASKSTAILSGKLVGKQKLLIGELPKITIKMGTTEIAVLPKTYSVIKLID